MLVVGIDTTREPAGEGTFGEKVVTLSCKRIAYLESREAYERGERATIDVAGDEYRALCRSGDAAPADAPAAVAALVDSPRSDRRRIGCAVSGEHAGRCARVLSSDGLLAAHDGSVTLDSVDSLARLLSRGLDDDELPPALERIGHRLGYVPLRSRPVRSGR